MSKKKIKLRKRRVFTDQFKRARVKEYETGEYTISELSRIFDIQSVILYRWIHKYSNYNKKSTVIVEMKDSATKKLKDYEKRIAELEQALGQKQLNIDYLEKMVELAKTELNIDLKKNFNTPSLTGSSKTGKE
jgi:transposase